jgi:TetR/AcrR family transcriptional regulator, cholesterol catabolism regulator
MRTDPMTIRDEVAALKRARIVEVAADLFYRNGYDNTTLEAVGESLGVTKPFIYAHFKSKTELLAQICSRAIESSSEVIDQAVALDVSATEKLETLAKGFVKAVLVNQKFIAIFNREEKALAKADLEEINKKRRKFDAQLTALLREGKTRGEFSIGDEHVAALSIGGMVSWAYVWFRTGGRMSVDEVSQEMSALILNLVNARR